MANRSLLRILVAAAVTGLLIAAGCGGDSDADDNQTDDNVTPNTDECPDPCEEGETRCTDGEVETCVSVDGCPTWSDPSACDDDLVCSDGECVDECTDTCEEGDSECDGDAAVRHCEMQDSGCYDWSSGESCEQGELCVDGSCEGCEDGDQTCASDGQTLQGCTDGTWEPIQSCPFSCEGDECVEETDCTPGDSRCNDNMVEVCNATGSAYLYVTTCEADCDDGQCTGDCEPGTRQCTDDDEVQVCNDDGDGWDVETTCDIACDSRIDDCVEEELSISSDTELNGTHVVDGPVTIHSGAEVTSSEGDLRIYASSITVEDGGSIDLDATGDHPAGAGVDGTSCSCGFQCTTTAGGTGASYAEEGESTICEDAPDAHGRSDDVYVVEGSRGGATSDGDGGGYGGGVLHLIADDIDLRGTINADGMPGEEYNGSSFCSGQAHSGGGSGGGVLVAADDLDVSGHISVEGRPGSGDDCTYEDGGDGGDGLVKFLHGSDYDNTGTVDGVQYEGLKAPLEIGSATHPDESLYYNDDFETLAFGWARPFGSTDGYYTDLNAEEFFVPDASNASYNPDETISYDRQDVEDGQNWLHLAPVDASNNIGELASRFRVNVNTLPPEVESPSHPDQSAWETNDDVYLEWTDQRDEQHFVGYYYTVDEYGDTVPDEDDTFVPVDDKQTLLADQPEGIWAFHIVPVDTMGYLTSEADTYVFRIGDAPGTGNVYGSVENEDGLDVPDATVTINRGLLTDLTDPVTDSDGSYNFGGDIPEGQWELSVSADGYETKYTTIDLDSEEEKNVDVVLTEQ